MTKETAADRFAPIRDAQLAICGLEDANDEAIIGAFELGAELVRIARAGRMSRHDAQPALALAGACALAHVELRAKQLELHVAMREGLGKMDLREFGWGDLPPTPGIGQEPGEPEFKANLSLVG